MEVKLVTEGAAGPNTPGLWASDQSASKQSLSFQLRLSNYLLLTPSSGTLLPSKILLKCVYDTHQSGDNNSHADLCVSGLSHCLLGLTSSRQ